MQQRLLDEIETLNANDESIERLGEELARQETLSIDDDRQNTIVVPVPDTAKAAADSGVAQRPVADLAAYLDTVARAGSDSARRPHSTAVSYSCAV